MDAEDVVFPEEEQEALKDGLTNAEEVKFEVIEGANHNTHFDKKEYAEKVAGLIADFISTK